MFITVHAFSGIAAASVFTQNPIAAFGIGIISHFFVDMIPHGDEFLGKKYTDKQKNIFFTMKIGALDTLVMLSSFALWNWFTAPSNIDIALSAVLGAIFPDALQGVAMIFPWQWLKKIQNFHNRVHNIFNINLSFPQGMIVQTIFLAGMIFFIGY